MRGLSCQAKVPENFGSTPAASYNKEYGRYPQYQNEQYANSYTEGKGRKGKEHTEGERERYRSPISDGSIDALMVD